MDKVNRNNLKAAGEIRGGSKVIVGFFSGRLFQKKEQITLFANPYSARSNSIENSSRKSIKNSPHWWLMNNLSMLMMRKRSNLSPGERVHDGAKRNNEEDFLAFSKPQRMFCDSMVCRRG